MALDHLADNFYVVLFAYGAAFLPWTALNTWDFISPTWRRARDIRVAGYFNIVFAAIPALYMFFYMIVQKGVDDKEMFAALIALLFALLHLVRTFWGLWQLHIFVKWAARSISSLRALGIEYQPHGEKVSSADDKQRNNDSPDEDVSRTDEQDEQNLDEGKVEPEWKLRSADEIALDLRVSDELIDNQLFHGNACCYLQFEEIAMKTDLNEPNRVGQRILMLGHLLSIPFRYVYRVVLMRFGRGSVPRFCQIPHKPEDVWLRWCVAFAAQGLGRWIREFTVAPEVDAEGCSLNNSELYERRRDHLASRVLATAGIQLWLGSCMPLGDHSLLSKTELMRRVMKSGDGLPFGASQRNVLDLPEKGYKKYSRKLGKIIDAIPVSFEEEVKELDIEKVEWLAILLNIGHDEMRKKSYVQQSLNRCDDSERLEHDDFAMENLRQQLGIGERFSGASVQEISIASMCGFPLKEGYLYSMSRDNRLVTKVGELIDCWLALMRGEQVEFLVERDSGWMQRCLSPELAVTSECFNENEGCAVETDRKENRVFTTHVRLEEATQAYQFGVVFQEFENLEQTMTFMGHSLEILRTSLGRWLKESGNKLSPSWRPVIFQVGELNTGWQIVGCTSEELYRVLHEREEDIILHDRAVQVRLVWELQCIVRESLSEAGEGPSDIRMVALCVLSFPSLVLRALRSNPGDPEKCRISHKSDRVAISQKGGAVSVLFAANDDRHSNLHPTKTSEPLCFSIVPNCAPQNVSLEVQLRDASATGTEVRVRLRRSASSRDAMFEWESWRDSAMGRMEGLRRWQGNHGMGRSDLHLTQGRITSGIGRVGSELKEGGEDFFTWSGWAPFRMKQCRLELDNRGLLAQFDVQKKAGALALSDGKVRSYFDRAVGEISFVRYVEARRESLQDGCLAMQEAMIEKGPNRSVRITTGATTTDNTQDLMTRAEELHSHGPWNMGRAVFLLKVAAMQRRDVGALRRCVQLLTHASITGGNAVRKTSSRQASELIKAFFDNSLSREKLEVGLVGRYNHFEELLSMLTKLVKEQCFDEIIVDNFLEFLVSALGFEVALNIRKCHEWMRRAILCSRKWKCLGFLASESDWGIHDIDDVRKNDRGNELRSARALFSDDHVMEYDAKTLCLLNKTILERVVLENMSLRSRSRHLKYILPDRKWMSDGKARKTIGQNGDARSSAEAMTDLGFLFRMGAPGVRCDAQRASKLFQAAVDEANNRFALLNLGDMLSRGEDAIELDVARAADLFERAIADYGDVTAMNDLAHLLERGTGGLERNLSRALDLYERSIEQGRYDKAMYNLANALIAHREAGELSGARGAALLQRVVDEHDDVDATIALGRVLHYGGPSVAQDAMRAAELYQRAISQAGDAAAMNNLGLLLLHGAGGVPRDACGAVELWERAMAEHGDGVAMYNLACTMRDGADGVARDAARAAALFEMAVDTCADSDAMVDLADLLRVGADGVARDVGRARQLYERAVDTDGHAEAVVHLAAMQQNGAEIREEEEEG